MSERMLNTKEVAEYLQLNEKKVYTLARAGRIPAVRLTGKWLFPKDALDAWLSEQAHGSVAAAEEVRPRGVSRPGAMVVAGSDDPLLRDLLRELSLRPENSLYAFAEVGSAQGMRTAASSQADLACSHLMEEGEFNLPFLPRLAPGLHGRVVTVARRRQGLLTAPGNPRGFRRVADLGREGVCIVNRQPGAGTRVLLDAELTRAGLDPGTIAGYDQEVSTHVEVAARVLRGDADAGLACETAARMLGVEFVPLCEERFDLIIPKDSERLPGTSALVGALRSPAFRRKAAALGGYLTEESGAVQADF